jgi:enterochelin esterase-like enzyme
VWVYATGDDPSAERPLAILLDGQFWAESMPVWPALAALTEQGLLPPAVYLLIDVIDTTHRSQELPCNPDFWLAVQQELLPQVQAITPFSDDAGRTVVAGQSFGGLSALYAALHWPQRFGCVLSQSGSFGGQRATASRMACLSNNSNAANYPRRAAYCAGSRGARADYFPGQSGPLCPITTHTADGFLASG